MIDKTFIFDKESGTISELIFKENNNERIFSLFKKEGWDNNQEKRVEVVFKNPNNHILIKDISGNSIEMSFDTLISLKEVIDHVCDFQGIRIFSKTISFK